MDQDKVYLFEDQPIRSAWVEDEEEWYFSIVDVVGVLTEQPDTDRARNYRKVLKIRLKEEGSQLVTKCNQLKMTAQDGKKRLTDEWDKRGVKKGAEYAILTDEITRAWSGMSTRQYKNLKGLKKENLRDNMSTLELVLNMLAEATTTELSKQQQPETFDENRNIAQEGGAVAGEARAAVEKRTGKPVITSKNAAQMQNIVTGLIESEINEEVIYEEDNNT